MENIKWLTPELVWFIIGLALMIAEFSMPGLILFFFGLSAWCVSGICFFMDVGLNSQLGIFIVLSLFFILFLRAQFQKIFRGKAVGENLEDQVKEEFLNKLAVVTKAISPSFPGKVEFNGTQWSAEADTDIPEGASVVIVDKKNITLVVKIKED